MPPRRVAWWCLVLSLTAAIATTVFFGAQQMVAKNQNAAPPDRPEQRSAVLQVTSVAIPKMLGYKPDTVESTLTDALSLMTRRYQAVFSERLHREIIPQARQRQLTNDVSVVGAGVEALSRDRAAVLVFVNRTVTAPGHGQYREGSRLRVQLQDVGGAWLIDDIDPV